jgi:hypothetical protein
MLLAIASAKKSRRPPTQIGERRQFENLPISML